MSHTSTSPDISSSTTISESETLILHVPSRKKLLSDDELETTKKNDAYWQKKRILDMASWCICGIIIFFTLMTMYMTIIDSSFRTQVMGVIQSKFETIILTALALFGIKVVSAN